MEAETFQTRWNNYLRDSNRSGVRIGAIFMVTIYPLFSILDYYTQPLELFVYFVSIRIVIFIYATFVLITLNRAFFNKYWRVLAGAVVCLPASGISLMMALNGGFGSPYYIGILLVILAASVLLVLPHRDNYLINGIILAVFFLVNAPSIPTSGISDMLTSSFFVAFSLVIVGVAENHAYNQAFKLFQQQYELERIHTDLEATNIRLKEMDKAKTQFFSNITHEFKTPLSLILLPLDMLSKDDLVAKDYSYQLDVIRRNGLKLLKLTNMILDLIKLDEARFILRPKSFDIKKIVEQIVGDIQGLAERKSIRLDIRADSGKYPITGDPDMLERVVVNLLSNAMKFTPPGGSITVALASKPHEIMITVSDTGMGIPADKISSIFERFYQVEGDLTRKHGGTGIGLALVKEIVDRHGGRIEVESEVGKGTSFSITLPENPLFENKTIEQPEGSIDELVPKVYKSQEYRYIEISDAIERRIVQRQPLDKSIKVLAVDDNPDVIRLLALILGKDFSVISAVHPQQGLELARKFHPNIVLTDLMMPDMNGFDFVKHLRTIPGMELIPVVMLTAKSELTTRLDSHESGVDYFLSKPFSADEVKAVVDNLLKKTEQQVDSFVEKEIDSLVTIAGGLAHEINNPLNYIKNAVEQVEEDVKTNPSIDVPRTLSLTKLALHGVTRIMTVVDLLKTYALDGISSDNTHYNIFDAVRATVDLVKPAINKECEVNLDLSGEAWINCRPEEVKLLLSNIIQNAIEAVDDNGNVRIEGRTEHEKVILTISNDGPAIPSEIKEKLFQPFFSTKGPGKGMGLGLTVVWRVARQMKADINIISPLKDEKGVAFVVKIPKLGPEHKQQSAVSV